MPPISRLDFDFNAKDCECSYKDGIVARNMCGHTDPCPVYKRWRELPEVQKMLGTITKCIVPVCTNQSAPALKRGLCMPCYSRAKKVVDSGKTTWGALVIMGLATDGEVDPFDIAFNAAQQKE